MTKNKTNYNKRLASTKEYIDKLSEHYSKLNVVRVDLSYKKPYSDTITLEEANKDIKHMFNNKRSKPSIFKDQVGYVCKKEYTKDKGVHFHAYFFYNGQKVQKSTYKADQIGNYWKDNITKEKGSYHNCHRNEYKYNGIGMLVHNDEEKRKNLDKAISYSFKDEQSINSLKESNNERAFTRGIAPKSDKEKMGRPRDESKL